MNYYLKVLTNFSFAGRARRAEYWWFFLFNLIVLIVLDQAGKAANLTWSPMGADAAELYGPYASMFAYSIPYLVYSFLVLIQTLALNVRRLHDRNMSGWWLLLFILLSFVLIGVIILLIICALPGTAGSNKYGEDPKAGAQPAPAAA